MKEFLAKIKSRKFIVTVVVVLANIAMLVFPKEQDTIVTILNLVISAVVVLFYVFVEGKLDEKAIKLGKDFVTKLLLALSEFGVIGRGSIPVITVDPDNGDVSITDIAKNTDKG